MSSNSRKQPEKPSEGSSSEATPRRGKTFAVSPVADAKAKVDEFGMPTDEVFWLDALATLDQELTELGWGLKPKFFSMKRPTGDEVLPGAEPDGEHGIVVFDEIDLEGATPEAALWGYNAPGEFGALVGAWERHVKVGPATSDDLLSGWEYIRVLVVVTRSGRVVGAIRLRDSEPVVVDLSLQISVQIMRRAIGAPINPSSPQVPVTELFLAYAAAKGAEAAEQFEDRKPPEADEALERSAVTTVLTRTLAELLVKAQLQGIISLTDYEYIELSDLVTSSLSSQIDRLTSLDMIEALAGALEASLEIEWGALIASPLGESIVRGNGVDWVFGHPGWASNRLLSQVMLAAVVARNGLLEDTPGPAKDVAKSFLDAMSPRPRVATQEMWERIGVPEADLRLPR